MDDCWLSRLVGLFYLFYQLGALLGGYFGLEGFDHHGRLTNLRVGLFVIITVLFGERVDKVKEPTCFGFRAARFRLLVNAVHLNTDSYHYFLESGNLVFGLVQLLHFWLLVTIVF